MKSITLTFKLALVMMAMAIGGCIGSSKQQIANIADSIDVSYQTGPRIGVNQDLTVWIKNQTAYCVSFPPDYGIKIFAETSDGWTEVSNLVTFVGNQPRSLKPKGDIFSERSIDVRPDVSALMLSQPTNFYVSISGHLCNDETVLVEKEIPFVVVP
jgi:hypothetical protein